MGIALQRLFSTFPSSWPGFGLLLLRCCLGIALTYSCIDGLLGNASGLVAFAQHAIAVVGGIFLIAGLWTPVMGTLLALDEFWIALSIRSLRARRRLDSHLPGSGGRECGDVGSWRMVDRFPPVRKEEDSISIPEVNGRPSK